MEENKLTLQERYFCELYAYGDAPYAGNPNRAYREAFNDDSKTATLKALQLMQREDIKECIEELELMEQVGSYKSVKKFLGQNLKHIVEECSTAQYVDRRGTKLSPAPLRSVAVSASKALMDLYPVKEAQKHELNIGGAGEGGITFNVIMPGQTQDPSSTEAE